MGKKLMVVPYYGGKFSHLNWLLPLLPDCDHYCESFGGSAAVLINRTPSAVETYNDKNKDIVNLFRQLRDNKERFVELVSLTPYSKEELDVAKRDTDDALEQARRTYIRLKQSVVVNQRAWKFSKVKAVRNAIYWANAIDKLPQIIDRLTKVQLECDDALKVIQRADSPRTLHYVDPPYPNEVLTAKAEYAYPMSNLDHIQLSRILHECLGQVAISGYRCDLYDALYKDWRREDGPRSMPASTRGVNGPGQSRQESLWCNY